jgi:hypothetical protein
MRAEVPFTGLAKSFCRIRMRANSLAGSLSQKAPLPAGLRRGEKT